MSVKASSPRQWRAMIHHNVEHRDLGTTDAFTSEELRAWTPNAEVAIQRAWGSEKEAPIYSLVVSLPKGQADIDVIVDSAGSASVLEQLEDLVVALGDALMEARDRSLFDPSSRPPAYIK